MNKSRKIINNPSPQNELLSFLKKEFPISSSKNITQKRIKCKKRLNINSLPNVMLSKKSRNVIEHLYDKICNAGIFHYSLETIPSEEIKPLHSYIPIEIRNCFHNKIVGRRATFQIGQRMVEIECIIPIYKENEIFEHDSKKVDDFVNHCIHQIYIWLTIAFPYASSQCSKRMNIYLYMTLEKKILPKQMGSQIRQIHANTAFTTSCAPITEINLYRREEWFKVFIHETFHSLGLDFSAMDSKKANMKMCSIFHVKSDVRLFETYCEMWAEIIQILFYLYMDKNTISTNLIPAFLRCIRYEKMFSVFQSVKILHFFGIQYKDLFSEENIAIEKYKESTQILSYYILKSISMVYINDFIEWCIDHNSNVLTFTNTEMIVDEYCDFFETHSQLSKYLEYVKIAESAFQDCRDHIPNNIKESMRMTVYG
jgi:hypothetical protein